MFHSAILRLTGWYLLILMVISLLFSVTIYNTTTSEIRDRLNDFQSRLEQPGAVPDMNPNPRLFNAFRNNQGSMAEKNIWTTLVYVNLIIFFGGGILSYLLARRTLRQIEESHDAQSRFTSDVSHELRTPLAAMKTELEVALRDKKLSKEDMRELLESNLEEVDKLTVLSKTLLQLSKLDHSELEIDSIDLGVLTSDVVQRYDKNMNRIRITAPAKPLTLQANAATIEELVTILVDNALKYSPQKTPITIKLARQGRQVIFSITNKGKGISPEDMPHIFDRFYRSETSRTTSGSGLGLSLAKKIVELQNGELSVSSATDKDTTFQFILPVERRN